MGNSETAVNALPKGGLGENVLWLTALQALNYLLPLATVPYLIRVLGAKDYGVLAFSVTFSQYLVVLTDYGFNLSATRQIAIQREDHQKLEETISAVMAIKCVLLVISACLLLLFLLLVPRYDSYAAVLGVAFLSVMGSVAFPVWLFQGLQDMRLVTILTAIGKLICTGAIFITVHSSRDVLSATLWTVSGFPIAGVVGWFVIRHRYPLRLRLPPFRTMCEEVRSGFHVFVSSVMSNALINGAVLVMGFTMPLTVVGTYAAVEKIAKAGAMGFAPLTQALYPRTAEHFAEGHAEGRRFVLRSGLLVLLLASVASISLALSAKWVLRLICGHGYAQYDLVIHILAIWLFLGVLNNILGIQYLLGSGLYRVYSACFTVSTVGTFVFLFLFIPRNPYLGAASAVTLGEALLSLSMAFMIFRGGGKLNKHYRRSDNEPAVSQ